MNTKIYNNPLNEKLQEEFKEKFSEYGILAYSNCCRVGCAKAYKTNFRNKGIVFFKLYLNGMNYDPHPYVIYIDYEDYDYLEKNWDREKQIIDMWCGILGIDQENYKIFFPENECESIVMEFSKMINLEEPSEEYKRFYRIMEYNSKDFKYNRSAFTRQ